MTANSADALLVERIRAGDADAWSELIDSYEGRLLAYVTARLSDKSAAEDVVQETLLGFLTSVPNYNPSRPLESYLFSIAAHKLTDHLRRAGRRPTVAWAEVDSDGAPWEPPGAERPASSLARSAERRHLEEHAIREALEDIIAGWRRDGHWQRLAAAELLFVRGMANKEVARDTGMSEQTVANQKFEFIARLRTALRRQGLSSDVFPELG